MRSGRHVSLLLVALLVLALVPAAQASVDYSKNAASGDYAPAVSAQPAPAPTTDSGFEWGDAAIGAAVALGLMAVVMLVRSGVGRSRGELAGPGSAPSATSS